ncbi:hypothetical protein FW320_06565 [Azospirillum sp. Vi22]|uniref:hypothetical protein n=1 Tax=Azospirillum baldaniorum TaxID=1064539 RepID=UPI00157AFB0C|nr:hypothetical protein [Azospirillum baldaniorum]NUB05838.1 hypothetical protein [Azospirillum baldaniorum]
MDQNQTQPTGQPKYIIHADAANAAMHLMCGFRSLGVAGDEEVCTPNSPELRAHLQAVLGPLPTWGQRGGTIVRNYADYLRALADVLAPPVAAEAQGATDEDAPLPNTVPVTPAPLSPVEKAGNLMKLAVGRFVRPERYVTGVGLTPGEPGVIAAITIDITARPSALKVAPFVSVKAATADFRSTVIAEGFDFDAVIAEAKEKLVALPTTPDIEEPAVEAPSAHEAPVPSEVA